MEDFNDGERVYHKTDPDTLMIVLSSGSVISDPDFPAGSELVRCVYRSKLGTLVDKDFLAVELEHYGPRKVNL